MASLKLFTVFGLFPPLPTEFITLFSYLYTGNAALNGFTYFFTGYSKSTCACIKDINISNTRKVIHKKGENRF